MKQITLIFVFALLTTACAAHQDNFSEGSAYLSGQTAQSAGASGLTKGFLITQNFVLSKVNQAEFKSSQAPTLKFGDNFVVSGQVCNSFRGPGDLKNDVLTVKPISSTRKLCPQSDLNELEATLFKLLEEGAEISMDGTTLILRQGGTTLFFERQL